MRIRVPAAVAGDAAALRTQAAQTLVRGVLDALEAVVHRRLGPRAIVRVRRLPLRWRLAASELCDRASHERLAGELADALLADAPSRGWGAAAIPLADRTARLMPRPRPGVQVAVFADEAHAIAAAIADLDDGHAPLVHPPASTIAELWQRAGGDAFEAIARLLAEYGVSEAALRDAPAELLARSPWLRAALSAPDGDDDVETVLRRAPDKDGALAIAEADTVLERDLVDDTVRDRDLRAFRTARRLALGIPTQLGGMFLLLSRVAELELAEQLWCAGVPEGPGIAEALALLAPHALRGDRALAVIAGAFDGERPPRGAFAACGDDVCAELRDKARDSLGRWLAVRGELVPPVVLGARLAALADDLDDPSAGDVAPVLAATIAALVCERLGVPWSLAPAQTLAVRDGAIAISDEEIRVELGADAIDVDLRRAGLDFDPGWVPWLERRVRIAYAGGEGEAWP